MTRTPEWADGLMFICRGCAREWPSLWARDLCMRQHDEDDRDARRR